MSRLRYRTGCPSNFKAFTSPMHRQSLFLEHRIVAIGSEMRSTSESSLGGGRNSGVFAVTDLF
jgi:hypothetical protein